MQELLHPLRDPPHSCGMFDTVRAMLEFPITGACRTKACHSRRKLCMAKRLQRLNMIRDAGSSIQIVKHVGHLKPDCSAGTL